MKPISQSNGRLYNQLHLKSQESAWMNISVGPIVITAWSLLESWVSSVYCCFKKKWKKCCFHNKKSLLLSFQVHRMPEGVRTYVRAIQSIGKIIVMRSRTKCTMLEVWPGVFYSLMHTCCCFCVRGFDSSLPLNLLCGLVWCNRISLRGGRVQPCQF